MEKQSLMHPKVVTCEDVHSIHAFRNKAKWRYNDNFCIP